MIFKAFFVLFAALQGQSGPAAIYPQAKLTSGDTLKVTAKTVCALGYAKTVPNVSETVKDKVMQSYGVTDKDCKKLGGCEIDHFIPVELGGSNEPKNLWPEPANTAVNGMIIGFRQKDLVENWLNVQVCKGILSLSEAQAAIRLDWYAVYTEMVDAKKAIKN